MDFPMASVTIQQMVIFMQVAEHGGFARASSYLHMTQSAISKSIAKLEKDLGIMLFQRTTREIHLTEAGDILYKEWGTIIRDIHNSYTKALSLQNETDNHLRIGILNTARPELYYWEIQDSFQKNHPEVQIDLRTTYMTDLIHELAQGEFDLIMIPDFERLLLAKMDLCWKWAACAHAQVIMSRKHPLANRSFLTTPDILYEKFTSLQSDDFQTHREDLIERFAKYHVMPQFIDTYRSAYDIKLLFRHQEDSLLMADDFFDCPADPILVKIPLIDQTNGIICAWNPNAVNNAAQMFLDELRPINMS